MIQAHQAATQHHHAYQQGYEKGRRIGYEKGYQEGMARGYEAAIMPIALIITASVELPSLKMMLLHPFERLKKLGLYNFRVRSEDAVSEEDIQSASIVIFIRNVEPVAYPHLETAHRLGKRTVYCIDDNFLEIPSAAQEFHYYREPFRREVFTQFLRNAQVVHVNSEFFAAFIRQHYNPKVEYFPATVDYEWLEKCEKPARSDDKVIIGYEGTYKEADFKPVVPVIKRLLEEYKGTIKVMFFGFIPSSLRGLEGIDHIPYEHDYQKFIHQLYGLSWDIGLAPLADTLFNHCKTNNKFREYGACMIPGIYSNIPTYASWVSHGETGYLVPHSEEGWYEGIKQMIESPDLRQKIKRQANAYGRDHFSIQSCVDNWKYKILGFT